MHVSRSPDDIQEKLGYWFSDQSLLERALTHTSYAVEHRSGRKQSNERLEYLGDAVLKAIIADRLVRLLEQADEGRLSKLSAQILSGRALAQVAMDLGVQDHIRLGRGEASSGGRTRRRNLAGAMEALIGAVYLDGGFAAAYDFVAKVMEPVVQQAVSGPPCDYKTGLQEHVAAAGIGPLSYKTIRAEGPSHRPWFTVEAAVDGRVIGVGEGPSKRAAQQSAAQDGMETLGLKRS